MRPKYVRDKKTLAKLASLYERQGYQVLQPQPDRIEAYDIKTGKLVKVVKINGH